MPTTNSMRSNERPGAVEGVAGLPFDQATVSRTASEMIYQSREGNFEIKISDGILSATQFTPGSKLNPDKTPQVELLLDLNGRTQAIAKFVHLVGEKLPESFAETHDRFRDFAREIGSPLECKFSEFDITMPDVQLKTLVDAPFEIQQFVRADSTGALRNLLSVEGMKLIDYESMLLYFDVVGMGPPNVFGMSAEVDQFKKDLVTMAHDLFGSLGLKCNFGYWGGDEGTPFIQYRSAEEAQATGKLSTVDAIGLYVVAANARGRELFPTTDKRVRDSQTASDARGFIREISTRALNRSENGERMSLDESREYFGTMVARFFDRIMKWSDEKTAPKYLNPKLIMTLESAIVGPIPAHPTIEQGFSAAITASNIATNARGHRTKVNRSAEIPVVEFSEHPLERAGERHAVDVAKANHSRTGEILSTVTDGDGEKLLTQIKLARLSCIDNSSENLVRYDVTKDMQLCNVLLVPMLGTTDIHITKLEMDCYGVYNNNLGMLEANFLTSEFGKMLGAQAGSALLVRMGGGDVFVIHTHPLPGEAADEVGIGMAAVLTKALDKNLGAELYKLGKKVLDKVYEKLGLPPKVVQDSDQAVPEAGRVTVGKSGIFPLSGGYTIGDAINRYQHSVLGKDFIPRLR